VAWREALAPWFRFWSGQAWRQSRPVIFLAPDSATIAWVKGRLAHSGVPCLGLEFLTPGGLRSKLRGGDARPLALREDLQLLMELAAAELPDNPVAQAAAQDPGDFLQHCDRLESAGWGPDAFDLPESRELAERFYALVSESGLQTTASVDRSLLSFAGDATLAQVLAYGFGPGHSGALTLLRLVAQQAESLVYCLPMVGEQSDELAWRSTLELIADSEELPSGPNRPLAELSEAAEFHKRMDNGGALKTAVVADIDTEARLIENEVHRWRGKLALGERIGVVFARDGLPLARVVARRLTDAGLAHQDEIGRQPGSQPAQILVEAWRNYQEQADADSARRLVRALRRVGRLTAEAEASAWKSLEKAFHKAMTTDLAVLLPMLQSTARSNLAASTLRQWPLLPERASFAEFTELCQPVLEKLGWPERLDAWALRAAALAEHLSQPLQRAQYLRWLAEVCRIPGRTRDAIGREAFAPVVLTTVERAAAQSWQYLIFAGLNRGDWPVEQNDGLILSAKLCSQLNRRACMDSPSGLGQQCLRPGRSWLASRLDERRHFAEACSQLLRNVQTDALFTAHRENPGDPGREQDLADWLGRLFHAEHGRQPNESEIREAERQAADALAQSEKVVRRFPELTEVWQRRRNPETPFDEYSFGFGKPPSEPMALSARAWEEALRRPAHAWLRHVLRVRPMQELQAQNPRAQAIGNWAHQWALPISREEAFLACPDAESWAALVERQAQQSRQSVADAFAQAGRALPDWWRIDWAIARSWARQFAESLLAFTRPADVAEWPSIGGEWTLPDAPLQLPGRPLDGLALSGRIDALLSDETPEVLNDLPPKHWPARAAAWIIDFKTGGDDPLSTKKLMQGEGIQLALYALALHSLGAERVQSILLRPGEVIEHQVSLEEILSLDEPWQIIARQASSGRFGMRGEQRTEFGFVGEYPLAHLGIKPVVLEAKWALTHELETD